VYALFISAIEMMLRANCLDVFYGKAQALHQLTIELAPGEVVALIGRNGAGKSTLLKAICGLARPKSGQVYLAGNDITSAPVHRIARQGIAYVPEDRQVFPNLSTEDNLAIAATGTDNQTFSRSSVYEIFPQLARKKYTRGENLSGGEQQMLSIGRALLTCPKVLLLDEPTEGLAPVVTQSVLNALKIIQEAGVAILLVEQNFRFSSKLADRQYLIDGGKIRWSGPTLEFAERRGEIESLLLA
jgi:branched-chain amino acid transport system ATP-binding protein